MNNMEESAAPIPSLLFPSRIRKFARLRSNQAFESMVHLMRENLDTKNVETKNGETLFARAKLGGSIGATVRLQVIPEGDTSTLELSFDYRNLLFVAVVFAVAVGGLSAVLGTPALWLGQIFTVALAYRVNSKVQRFLKGVNEALPHLEREYARVALAEDRRRWQAEPKDTQALHRRLRDKHMKTWGNTRILDYKIAEYERQGLSRNESVRKAAEEEGIF